MTVSLDDIDWISAAKALGGPAIGFVFGSLLTSYVQWGFEKKKQILARRRELVTGWRLNLLPMIGQPQQMPVVWAGDRQRTVMSSPYYASLRPHLTSKAIKAIEDPTIKLFVRVDYSKPKTNDWSHQYPLKVFVDEIARIERKWKLV
ncbi:hypothetical protein IVB14_24450 [Bradyrhizobium sp. 180]|uniref:hypothetical protein n=1 Tax=unclassified Bradyrhizobium TaxID=2631580 RepID=UPI001FF749D5|nr:MULTISPECIES: hypothetical protein [unclassified Bradyrhizobium]MCK1493488.1 hypothetical protein [Bradyrhizobium sp. 180]MCK1754129.1 hypothetical protein [Bradyrhizobium sp. 137]